MNKKVDFVIVGQGIAGTLLHYLLSKEGLTGIVVDKGHEESASKVASGLINPITGRKYVRSWMFDELKSELTKLYKELEKVLGIQCFDDHKIVRVLNSIKEENLWYTKSTTLGYEKYFVDEVDSTAYENMIKDATSFGEVRDGAKVDLALLIEAYRDKLSASESLITAAFDYDELSKENDGSWSYQALSFDKIIFCEGWRLKFNPYFPKQGQESAKGEALIVRLKGVKLEPSIKKKIFITPLNGDLYWVGSTYQWEFEDHKPTSAKKEYLIEALDKMLDLDYEVVDHIAGVRPTTLDRRPLLGQHPKNSKMYVFSGLGTKGASLAPYWAKQMMRLIIHSEEVPSEADIARFS